MYEFFTRVTAIVFCVLMLLFFVLAVLIIAGLIIGAVVLAAQGIVFIINASFNCPCF